VWLFVYCVFMFWVAWPFILWVESLFASAIETMQWYNPSINPIPLNVVVNAFFGRGKAPLGMRNLLPRTESPVPNHLITPFSLAQPMWQPAAMLSSCNWPTSVPAAATSTVPAAATTSYWPNWLRMPLRRTRQLARKIIKLDEHVFCLVSQSWF